MLATIDLNTVPLDRVPLLLRPTKKKLTTTGRAHCIHDNYARSTYGRWLPRRCTRDDPGTLFNRLREPRPTRALTLPGEAPA
ncbi:hypothetical protein [Streptomyces sp. TR02-1]|uniref:hypothetical protein n=1 Tax=Streptomyces sp. TR02-1 TaxID=3385977 RepID=UPI0039A061E8